MLDVTAVLFAKSISSRFPNKNLSNFAKKNGKAISLLEWKISQLLEVFDSKKIMLSSDSEEILEMGDSFNLKLQLRPLEIAESDFTTNLKFAAKDVTSEYFLYTNGPCYPLLFPDRYKEFLEFCSKNEHLLGDGIFGMETIKGFLLFEQKYLNFHPMNMAYSQNLSNVGRVVWGLTLRENANVLNDGALFSNPANYFEVPSMEAIDIDFKADMMMAQSILAAIDPATAL
jgi:CMP-N-acetylneuraminic acid synthetase